jgi:hypothetical protein
MAKKSFKEGINSLLKKTDTQEEKKSPSARKVVAENKEKNTPTKPAARKTTKNPATKQAGTKNPATAKKQAVKKPDENTRKKAVADKGNIIEVPAIINIDNATAFKNQLLKDSKDKKSFILQGKVEQIDLTAVQEIIALKENAQKNKVNVQFKIELADEPRKLLKNAGLYDLEVFS